MAGLAETMARHGVLGEVINGKQMKNLLNRAARQIAFWDHLQAKIWAYNGEDGYPALLSEPARGVQWQYPRLCWTRGNVEIYKGLKFVILFTCMHQQMSYFIIFHH